MFRRWKILVALFLMLSIVLGLTGQVNSEKNGKEKRKVRVKLKKEGKDKEVTVSAKDKRKNTETKVSVDVDFIPKKSKAIHDKKKNIYVLTFAKFSLFVEINWENIIRIPKNMGVAFKKHEKGRAVLANIFFELFAKSIVEDKVSTPDKVEVKGKTVKKASETKEKIFSIIEKDAEKETKKELEEGLEYANKVYEEMTAKGIEIEEAIEKSLEKVAKKYSFKFPTSKKGKDKIRKVIEKKMKEKNKKKSKKDK